MTGTVKRWISSAQSTYDLWTLSLSGTVTSQTYTITINSKTVVYVAGSLDTVATIMAAFVTAWNSTSNPVPSEFKELTATTDGTNVYLTGVQSGVPHTVTFATSGAATISATNTTAATGPNDFANAYNWSNSIAPTNGDTFIFDSGAGQCLYNLGTSLTGCTVIVNPNYTGQIGLPDINTTNSNGSYFEYRTRYLTLAGGNATINAPSVNLCRLAWGSNTYTAEIQNSGPGVSGTPAVLITGGNVSSKCYVIKGSVGLAALATETGECAFTQSYLANQAGDANVIIGSGQTITTVSKTGGVLVMNCGCTTFTQGPTGGTTTIQGSGAITTLNVNGGLCYPNSTGTVTNCTIQNDGVMNMNTDSQAKTFTNAITMYGPSARLMDDSKVINSGVLSVVTTGCPTANISHGLSNTVSLT